MMILFHNTSSVQHMDDFLPFVYFLSTAVKKERFHLMDQQRIILHFFGFFSDFSTFLLSSEHTQENEAVFWFIF
jgi:hypothetical protein